MDMMAIRRQVLAFNGLPQEYQKYDWVQSNSMNARIDTGVSGDDNTLGIICTFMPIELVNSYAGIFGNYKNENDYYCWRVILSARTAQYFNAQLYICCGNNSAGGGTNTLYPTFNGTSMVNKKFTVRMSYGTATITGEKEETKTTPYKEKQINDTTIAIGSSRPSADGGSSKFRFYAFKIYSHDKLIRDYRPCVRKSDNKAGFYDMVNHTFNPSIGSQDFIAGND